MHYPDGRIRKKLKTRKIFGGFKTKHFCIKAFIEINSCKNNPPEKLPGF